MINQQFQLLAEQALNDVSSSRTLQDGQIERAWHPDRFNQAYGEAIVRRCALIAGLMEHEERKMIGAHILDAFGIADQSAEQWKTDVKKIGGLDL
jgi:hypothetical protein